ncbi:MAG: FHA domain-containing protein [Candidatus Bruticola sp.]
MVEQSDILSKLKDGFGLASKLAGKGVNEVSGMFKHDDSSRSPRSGVFWNRGSWSTTSGLAPQIDFFEPQIGLGFASSMVQRLTLSRAERLFGEACTCLTCIETETAVNRLREAVQLDTQFTDAYFLLGCILLEFGSASEAGSFFQKALLCQQGLGSKLKKYLPSFKVILPLTPWSSVALLPDLLGVNILLALSWRRSGNLSMAVSVLEQILSIMPTSALAKFFMGILHLEAGQYTEVINLFADCKIESTIEAACLLLVGKAYQKIGSFTVLAELYDQALARADIDVVVRYDLLLSQSESRTLSPNSRAQVEAQIVKECPQYVNFFKRLGIEVDANSHAVSSSQIASNSSSMLSNSASNNSVSVVSREELSRPGQESSAPTQLEKNSNSVSAISDSVSTFVPPIQAVPVEEGPRTVHMSTLEAQPISSAPTKPMTISEADYLNLQLSLEALGKLYPLQNSITLIGRESGDIMLSSDSSVSYTHARVVKSPLNGHYFLEDLGSTNGSWLNGNRLASNQKYELKHGDFIKLGQTNIKVV